MNEAETRAEHIDPALRAAGWGVVEGSSIRREYNITLGRIESHGRRAKPLRADYILEYRNTKLAVVEAKAWDEALTEGVGQAKEYAGKLSLRFTYASNGQGIYGIDMQTGKEGEITSYPSPEELWKATFPSTGSGQAPSMDSTGSPQAGSGQAPSMDSTTSPQAGSGTAGSELAELWRDRFAEIPFEDKGGSHLGRYYQETAVERVLEAIAQERNRILLTLATGTGKTFIAFQIAWKLFQSRWNLSAMGSTSSPQGGSATDYVARRPRILFLADRNILANQAFNAFSAFPDDALIRIKPDEIKKKGRVPKNGSIFFTIFQTFMTSTSSATDSTSSATETGTETELDFPEITKICDADAYTYILGCSDGSFYTGSTRSLRERLNEHQLGIGSSHTGSFLPVRLLYYETHQHIGQAFEREKQIQGWNRAKKIALITGDVERLKRLSRSYAASVKPVPEPAEASDPDLVTEPAEVFGDYPPDFFDFIIIDECHRGGANDESNWRGILEYFAPAVQLGLTATPKREENADTYRYFGEPVFIYSLKEGINDGFLTPFKVKQISTTLDTYTYTSDDTVVEGEVESGRVYEEKDFNKIIEIPERERLRVKLFMELINQNEKTLVFCATQHHALVIRDAINQIKKSTDPNYCQRVTSDDGERGEQYLRDFQDNEKSIPTILTTSQKLSTGVDARNIRNIVLMRPINSMIEFKQIIGRGTRLFDGKSYFTIYDFVKASRNFSDPGWDGEPLPPDDPEACKICGHYPCGCEVGEPQPCPACGKTTCACPKEPCPDCGQRPCVCIRRAKIKLADGKERMIQHMTVSSYWHPDGTPISAHQFLELLLGKIPEFFTNEDELRRLWSEPSTRSQLLQGLADKGFGFEQLAEIQKIIDAEKSDLFDVLAYVAYAIAPVTRKERADHASIYINTKFPAKQKAFLDFVLSHYVSEGVQELDQEKLAPLLLLKYHTYNEAKANLGEAREIGKAFSGFQKYLYEAVL